MTTRLSLLDMIARLQLDTNRAAALWRLAGFECSPPRQLFARMRQGLTVVGAACIGLGLIFWVASNWNLLSRTQQFALLQIMVLGPYAAAAAFGRGHTALSLFALVATGCLFAYFGQTYQSGADTWELFAAWAALVLPLALCTRSDAVWSAWVIVALTGVTLWCDAHGGFEALYGAPSIVYLIPTSCATGLTFLLSKIFRRYTGAKEWAYGIALVLATSMATSTALIDLQKSSTGHYWLCLLLGGTVAAVLANDKPFDVFSASVVGLALNVMLFAGVIELLTKGGNGHGGNDYVILLVLVVLAASMLAGSVKLILMRASVDTEHGDQR